MEDYVRGANELTKLSQAESRQLFDILSAPSSSDQSVNRANQANALRSDSATLRTGPATSTCPTSSPTRTTTWSRPWIFAVTPSLGWPTAAGRARPGGAAQQHRSDRGDDEGLPRERRAAQNRFEPSGTRRFRRRTWTRRSSRRRCPSSRTSNGSTPTSWPTRSPAFAAPTAARPPGGTHGNGLGTVSLGGVALTPGASATVPLTSDIAFDIQVVNQGESTETDVVGRGERRAGR